MSDYGMRNNGLNRARHQGREQSNFNLALDEVILSSAYSLFMHNNTQFIARGAYMGGEGHLYVMAAIYSPKKGNVTIYEMIRQTEDDKLAVTENSFEFTSLTAIVKSAGDHDNLRSTLIMNTEDGQKMRPIYGATSGEFISLLKAAVQVGIESVSKGRELEKDTLEEAVYQHTNNILRDE